MATAQELEGFMFFKKLYIKDGYWQMVIGREDANNFFLCNAPTSSQASQLFIPYSLHMAWKESPTYFCAASETLHYIMVDYCEKQEGTFPEDELVLPPGA